MGLAEHCVALKSMKVLSGTVGADESTKVHEDAESQVQLLEAVLTLKRIFAADELSENFISSCFCAEGKETGLQHGIC